MVTNVDVKSSCPIVLAVLALLFAFSARSRTAERQPPVNRESFAEEPAFQDDFDPGWEEKQRAWRVATWMQNGTRMSPKRCATNEDGHLVQTVLPGKPYRGGSLQTDREFGYGRWVAWVRPSAVPGALNSIFIKDWDDLTTDDSDSDGTGFEIDIEFLTYTFGPDRGRVHVAVHRKGAKSYSRDVDLDFNPSDGFHKWGYDILPGRVVWHVDGEVLHTWEAPEGVIVRDDYEFFFNSWTMRKWIKGPPEEPAHYHIDWLRFYPLKD